MAESIPIPLAITGHRDLHPDAEPPLRASLASLFTDLSAAHPHSDLLLLTGLAEGADRLAAEVALDAGLDVVAVLPLPDALYRQDFPDSQPAYDALKARCCAVFELPVPRGDDVSTHGPARDACYRRLGDWLTRYSFVLIALWDGLPGRGEGGTATVVSTELTGRHGREVEGLQDDPVGGTVCHMLTRRAGEPPPEGEAQRWLSQKDGLTEETPGPGLPGGGVFPLLAHLDQLNEEQAGANVRQAGEVLRSARYFLPHQDQAALTAGQRTLLRHYALADATAGRFQQIRHRTLIILSAVALAAISALELYKEALGAQGWALGVLCIYPLGLLFAWTRLRWAKDRGYDTRQLDYRALAEGLRIQLAWALGGLHDDVTDGYLHTQRGEFQWVRGAIRACVLRARITSDDVVAAKPAFELVRRRWIADQGGYFRRSVVKKQAEAARYARFVQTMFWLSFAASLALGPARVLGWKVPQLAALQVDGAFELAAAVALAAAAALAAFSDRLHLPELSRQHDRMFLVFQRAERRMKTLADAGETERAQAVLLELGKAALHENAAWVLLHRSRPMEAPGAAA